MTIAHACEGHVMKVSIPSLRCSVAPQLVGWYGSPHIRSKVTPNIDPGHRESPENASSINIQTELGLSKQHQIPVMMHLISILSSPLFSSRMSCQVIYSQFSLAIHQNDHQARRRFVEWAQNEIAVVPDFHKRILFSDEAPFWLNGYVNKQNCRIWSEANPQVYVETPLYPEKLIVWCALWAGGILLQKR
ncbi:hypothetical protein TNCV_1578581 [Trichonephila clavipes]|nr:hypothetical protein TNCV_1578581 [Trichonephila clavipes]